ncbi:hypothetical protein [Thermobifida halotolerans]|nr:hypothetical protein [Thermobifida halotolerans]
MLSGWELGRHTTTRRYRTLLADYYGQPVEELFAHQDKAAEADELPRLLTDPRELREAVVQVAENARVFLAVTGSRSRDVPYLEAIEKTLAAHPALVHYRLLFGSPRTPALAAHLCVRFRFRCGAGAADRRTVVGARPAGLRCRHPCRDHR